MKKAAHFLEKYIEICEANPSGPVGVASAHALSTDEYKVEFTFCEDVKCPIAGPHFAHRRKEGEGDQPR